MAGRVVAGGFVRVVVAVAVLATATPAAVAGDGDAAPAQTRDSAPETSADTERSTAAPGQTPAPANRSNAAPGEPPVQTPGPSPTATSSSGTGRLALSTGFAGAIVGLYLVNAVERPVDDSDGLTAMAAGALVGAGSSFIFGRDIPRNEAAAIELGMLAGFLTLGASADLLGADFDGATAAAISGLFGFSFAGQWLVREYGITHGQVAGATLVTLLAYHAAITLDVTLDPASVQTSNAITLGLGSAGLAGGMLLAPRLDWSINRARWITLSAAAGGIATGLAADTWLADSPDDEVRTAQLSLAGALLGGTTAYLLTRSMRPGVPAEKPSSELTIAPSLGDVTGLSLLGRF